jgi:ribosomal-protein-alanine N-acetyltransferase
MKLLAKELPMECTIADLPLPFITSRLTIRQLLPIDESDFLALYRDPDVMHFLGAGTQKSPETRWRQVVSSPSMFTQQLAVVRLDSNEFIGLCGFLDKPEEQFERWVLLRPYLWRHGYGAEISAKLTEVAFNALDARLVFGIIDPANVASLAMVKKLGYSFLGEYSNSKNLNDWQNGHHKYGLACQPDG